MPCVAMCALLSQRKGVSRAVRSAALGGQGTFISPLLFTRSVKICRASFDCPSAASSAESLRPCLQENQAGVAEPP